jgi:multicomponent Na+:H+ antiporter subunit D
MSIAPLLFIAIPLVAAVLVALLAKPWRRAGDVLATAASLALLILSLVLVRRVLDGETFSYDVGPASALGLHLKIDGLSLLLVGIVSLLTLMADLYAISYMERYTSKPRYYVLRLLMAMGMNAAVMGADMVNLYAGVEIGSMACYALVAYGMERNYLGASFRYQVFGAFASLLIIAGIALVYREAGTLNLSQLHAFVGRQGMTPTLLFSAVLFLTGFGIKSAIVPFHTWLPDAHSVAPTPVSALLSGVFVKAAGMYVLARLFLGVFELSHTVSMTLMVLGSVSLILALFMALVQNDCKRLLAYSTVSQMGYILLGFGLGTPLGILGAVFHLMNHAVFKSLLFMNAGAVEAAAGTRDLRELGGLGQRMPVTRATSVIASLSISGIPPFNGFWSKLLIIIAAAQAGYPVFAVVAGLGSVLALAAFLKLQRHTFFGSLPERFKAVREAPLAMCLPMVLLAALCVGIGLAFPFFIDNFLDKAATTLAVLVSVR